MRLFIAILNFREVLFYFRELFVIFERGSSRMATRGRIIPNIVSIKIT